MKAKVCIGLIVLTCSTSIIASPIGLNLSLPLIDKDPPNTHGYRAAITYQPECLVWNKLSLYFDAAFGHWWVNGNVPNKSLNIYSIAPYLRYYLIKTPTVSPFIEASIGASYLTKTRFETYNQGIHFSFQDQLTVGTAFGPKQNAYISFTALHYSNGSMSSSNAGITVPLVINVGYRF